MIQGLRRELPIPAWMRPGYTGWRWLNARTLVRLAPSGLVEFLTQVCGPTCGCDECREYYKGKDDENH